MSDYSRRDVIAIMTAAGLGGVASSPAAARGRDEHHDHEDGATLNRLATTVRGAEITGMFLTENGRFFFNVQHPSGANDQPYDKGTVGALTGANLNDLPRDFASVAVPDTEDGNETVHTAVGRYQPLANGGDPTDNGEQLGVPYSADGTPMTSGDTPDYNGFIPADHPNEAYLFTNWETRPGMMSRLHLRMQGRQGQSTNHEWEVLGKQNVDFRDVGGTWVNCFGTVSPWGTPLSSEENYSATNTDQWNNPSAGRVGSKERLADYLGGEPNENGVYDEIYPNPYRYGYILEIENPKDDPTPQKRFALGLSTHENAVVMPDQRTAYTTSDGTGRAFYKFVADDPHDLSSGSLYAAKATQQGSAGGAPAEVGFELEWIELASASEDEIESWIAEYDDITQADYEEGETSYITQEEVDEWAAGNAADDRVAFLETNRAASALGATDEFRKMEGVNLKRNARPGDYLYVAMSNTNATMADEEGDIQLDGDRWGAVYRMQLEGDYNVSRMEPVVTGGPDANICGGCPYDTEGSNGQVCQSCTHNPNRQDKEGFLGNGMRKMKNVVSMNGSYDPENTISEPDNLLVMDDGRVVIGEDTGNQGHDPPNMIWVYDPADSEDNNRRGRGGRRGRR